jgi:hypothetical protein
MSATPPHGYLLIFRGTDGCQGLSPEQMQPVMDQRMAWFNRLKDQGTVLAGLTPAKIVLQKNKYLTITLEGTI